MRVLFLSRWFPYPADNGSRIRIFNLLKHLAIQHEVALVSFSEAEPAADALAVMQQVCSVVDVAPYRPFQPTRWAAVAGLVSKRPRSVVDTYRKEMAHLVQNIARGFDPEAVIASEIDMAPYGLLVPKTIRILEDVELALLSEAAARAPDGMSRLRRNLTWWKHARYVADLLRQHDGCTVVSEREYGLVKQIAPESLKVRVVPNGVDLAHLDGNFGAPLPGTLIYTGALTYSANLDAMRYFVGEILPLIVVQQPDVKLAITGSIADIPADQLPAHPCVDFTGYLPDIRPAVAQSTVSVVPLRVGGGTRLKILESLALGTPVVTTSKGLEGLDIAAGEGVLIADEPEDFAEAVLRVLQDAALRSDLSRDGRRAVQQYDWARVGPQLVRFVAELAASAREPVL